MNSPRRAESGPSDSPGGDTRGRSEEPVDCPECRGRLSEPVSGPVHCYRECERCGARFQLDDPRLA